MFNAAFDLIAVNIMRGRDHGIPGYVEYLEACQVGKVECFDDLKQFVEEDAVEDMKKLYKNVEDVDLLVGLYSELRDKEDSPVGKTSRCIIADTFLRLMVGDKYFYDNRRHGKRPGFTKRQLRTLKKTTLSRILCENVDNLEKVQRESMLLVGKNNVEVDCGRFDNLILKFSDDRSG